MSSRRGGLREQRVAALAGSAALRATARATLGDTPRHSQGDFAFDVQMAFISITKEAGLANVPHFNEALTVVFTSESSPGVQALDQQPHGLALYLRNPQLLGFKPLVYVFRGLLGGQLGG